MDLEIVMALASALILTSSVARGISDWLVKNQKAKITVKKNGEEVIVTGTPDKDAINRILEAISQAEKPADSETSGQERMK